MATKDLDQLMQECPEANGLAIIISNDYIELKEIESLTGTAVDAKHMMDTFTALNFATYYQKNIRKEKLMDVVRSAASYGEYPTSYRRIIVVFSGHGTNEQLFTQEGKRVEINDMLRPFHPERAPILGNIPKLFFIDACRGEKTNPGVYVSRGGELVSTLQVPKQGNFLIAYSTMPEYQSYEVKGQGGIWITALAKKLKEENASVLDILTKVNKEMVCEFQRPGRGKSMQQPELLSRLNEEVNLLKESKGHDSAECSSGRDTTNTVPSTDCNGEWLPTQARKYDIQPAVHVWPPLTPQQSPPHATDTTLTHPTILTPSVKANRKRSGSLPRQTKRKNVRTPKDQHLDSSPKENASIKTANTVEKISSKEMSTARARRTSAKKQASKSSSKASGRTTALVNASYQHAQDHEERSHSTQDPRAIDESSNPISQTCSPETKEDTTAVHSEEPAQDGAQDSSSITSQKICYKRTASAPAKLEVVRPKLAMYTNPVEKLYHYCIEKRKPEPKYYEPQETLDGQFVIIVYVAQTCGRTKGDARSTVQEAKEDAAEKLLRKLHIY